MFNILFARIDVLNDNILYNAVFFVLFIMLKNSIVLDCFQKRIRKKKHIEMDFWPVLYNAYIQANRIYVAPAVTDKSCLQMLYTPGCTN